MLVSLASLLVAAPAAAFNRLHGSPGDGGPPLAWQQMPVHYALQSRCALGDEPNALNPIVADAGEDEATFNQLCHAAIQRAFDSWQAPACTVLRFNQLPDTPKREVGYDPSLGSANLNTVQFMTQSCDQIVDSADPCWNEDSCDGKYTCFGLGSEVVAFTSTHSDSNGNLLDVDIEGNAADFFFSAEAGDPLPGSIDVQNTFTHEAGHFIGLAHSCEDGQSCAPDLVDTAMYWNESSPQETTKRTLKQDDIDGVCTIYPIDGGTDPGGCQASPGDLPPDLLGLLLLLGVGLTLASRMRSSAGA